MNSLPHGSVPFRWHDHLTALRWLGLLYRRPQQFRDDLLTDSVEQQLIMPVWLLIHSAPYVFVFPAASYLLRIRLDGSEFQIGYLAGWIAFGIALGIADGFVFGIALGISRGIAIGIASGIAIGIAFEIGVGMFVGIGGGIGGMITLGIALGIGEGILDGISSGSAGGISGGAAVGIMCGLISSRISVGISVGIAFAISFTRIYYQLMHPLFVWPRLHGRWYRRHPVAWDDLCRVPFPWLDRLLVDYAEKVPESGLAEIERLISSYPSQRMMAWRARVRLLARQAGKTANLGILDEMVSALPKGEKGFLAQSEQLCAAVHEVSTLQGQLDAIDRPVLREPLAQLLCQEIENFRHRIGGFEEPLATEFRTAADQWLKIAEKQLREAQAREGKEPVL